MILQQFTEKNSRYTENRLIVTQLKRYINNVIIRIQKNNYYQKGQDTICLPDKQAMFQIRHSSQYYSSSGSHVLYNAITSTYSN